MIFAKVGSIAATSTTPHALPASAKQDPPMIDTLMLAFSCHRFSHPLRFPCVVLRSYVVAEYASLEYHLNAGVSGMVVLDSAAEWASSTTSEFAMKHSTCLAGR